MQYDPIKRSLGKVFNTTPFLRVLFYKLLNLLLLRTWYIKRELRKWRDAAGDNIEVLDAGSGFGQYEHFLASLNKNWKVVGYDIKDEQVADCNAFYTKIGLGDRVHYEVQDLTKLHDNERYDLVITIDVMEHILEDVLVFRNYHKVMKKGAMLLITTPSDQGGSDVHHDHEESFIDEHVRDGYNINEIEEKLKTAGFSKVDARYTYGKPGSLSWKLSMKYPITMLNKSKLLFVILPFYYIATYPIAFVLNYFDVAGKHKKGTGLIVKAWK